MCGIAGIISDSDSSRALTAMLTATIHRGPDNTGTFSWENVHFGMNRLSILDTSIVGNQPIVSEDGRYAMVYNGEVYNYKDLKSKLVDLGFVFKSETDTEVVFKSIIHFGIQIVSSFRGMFGFAFLDMQLKHLYLVRDQFGIKPIYLYNQNSTFIFCSELKGMLASGLIPSRLNTKALNSFLYWGAPYSNESAIEGITPIDPGTYVKLDLSSYKIEIKRYWNHVSLENKLQFSSYEEVVETTRNTLIESVKEQLVSDVPIGMFLSGGMDSNILVACTKILGLTNVNTVSLGFETENLDIDERGFAEFSAKHFGTKHYSRVVTSNEVSGNFEHFIHGLDQFSTDGLNSYWVSKVAKESVTVSLSGLGADEYFGGYLGFKNILESPRKAFSLKLLNTLDKSFSKFNGRLSSSLKMRVGKWNDLVQFTYMMNKTAPEQFLSKGVKEKDFILGFESYLESQENACSNRSNRVKQFYIYRHMLSQLLRDTDAVSMSHSLEVRVPFLDTRLAEISFSTLDNYLIKNSSSSGYQRSYGSDGLKRILGDAFKEEMPNGFFERKKTGFQLPFNNWMKNGLKTRIVDTLNSRNDYLNYAAIQNELKLWEQGKTGWKSIYMLFVFQSWCNANKIS